MRLANKNILITGATSGIGLASLEQSIKEGAFVIFTGRNKENIDRLQEKYPQQTLGIVSDISLIDDQKELVNQLKNQNIRLDAVFLNAGNVMHKPFELWTPEDFDAIFNTNVKGPFFFVQAAASIFNENASIIFNGTADIHFALDHSDLYAASKITLRSLVRTLSKTFIEQKVRFNLLSPGPTDTPAFDKVAPTPEIKQAMIASISKLVPAKRMATAKEVASAFIYLASDESRYMIGSELLLDGGAVNL